MGKIQLNPIVYPALIKPDKRLAFRIVKERLQLSTLVADVSQQRRLNAADNR